MSSFLKPFALFVLLTITTKLPLDYDYVHNVYVGDNLLRIDLLWKELLKCSKYLLAFVFEHSGSFHNIFFHYGTDSYVGVLEENKIDETSLGKIQLC